LGGGLVLPPCHFGDMYRGLEGEMLFQAMSDLHLDWHRDNGKEFIGSLPRLADTIVLAGDIADHSRILSVLTMFSEKWKNVVFVMGNHEFWLAHPVEFSFLKKRKPDNVHILDCEAVEIEKQRFCGATLWFHDNPTISRDWSDFKNISWLHALCKQEHYRAVEFFSSCYDEDIFVTHHLPTKKVLHPKYVNNQNSVYYATNLEPLMDVVKPSFWICGHTHEAGEVKVYDTTVLVNPAGYIGREFGMNGFRETLVVDTYQGIVC
jgi:Icc-related predicted phosphoesterase